MLHRGIRAGVGAAGHSRLAGRTSLAILGNTQTGAGLRFVGSATPGEEDRARSPPVGTFVESDLTPNASTKRPIPLNVQLTHFAPLKLPPTHGDLVAEVTVSSFLSVKDIDFVADFLLRAAFYLGIPAKGPTPMPRKTKRWTVIRSPFVQAKSKENWERVTWRRQIKLYDANPEVVQIFLAIAAKHSLAGVGVKAVTYTQESADAVANMDVGTQSDRENPLAINKVDLDSPSGDVAKAVLELLKDPRFAADSELHAQIKSQLDETAPAVDAPPAESANKEADKKPKN